jgi:hypothetical protein
MVMKRMRSVLVAKERGLLARAFCTGRKVSLKREWIDAQQGSPRIIDCCVEGQREYL